MAAVGGGVRGLLSTGGLIILYTLSFDSHAIIMLLISQIFVASISLF
jgi:hypothetical protein